jgi:hypothetical protein
MLASDNLVRGSDHPLVERGAYLQGRLELFGPGKVKVLETKTMDARRRC